MRKATLLTIIVFTILLAGCVSQDDYDSLQKSYSSLEDDNEELEDEIKELEDKVADYEDLETDIERLEAENADLKAQLADAETENENLDAQIVELQSGYDEVTEALADSMGSEALARFKDIFSDYPNMKMSETVDGRSKILYISVQVALSDYDKDDFTDAIEKLANTSLESWVDYDFIEISLWNKQIGMLTTSIIDMRGQIDAETHSWGSTE